MKRLLTLMVSAAAAITLSPAPGWAPSFVTPDTSPSVNAIDPIGPLFPGSTIPGMLPTDILDDLLPANPSLPQTPSTPSTPTTPDTGSGTSSTTYPGWGSGSISISVTTLPAATSQSAGTATAPPLAQQGCAEYDHAALGFNRTALAEPGHLQTWRLKLNQTGLLTASSESDGGDDPTGFLLLPSDPECLGADALDDIEAFMADEGFDLFQRDDFVNYDDDSARISIFCSRSGSGRVIITSSCTTIRNPKCSPV